MTASPPPLILHVFPSFAVGGAQMRMATLANRFGPRFRHAIIALDQQTACRDQLDPQLDVQLIAPPTPARALPARLRAIRALLRRIAPDLLITSNWGAIEWAMARPLARIARHIHTEDGFGPEEHQTQLPRRVLTRRVVLRQSDVVVPSTLLHQAARNIWRLPEPRIHYIPNGIDLTRFTPNPNSANSRTNPGLTILCVAGLRPEKNIDRLLRALALARLSPAPHLLIAGDGPERAALQTLATDLALKVTFLGNVADPAPLYQTADLFALSSDTEQMPLSVIEAMASGLPVIATAVGDISAMVAEANLPLLTAPNDQALADALQQAHRLDRTMIGAENRRKAERLFDVAVMTAQWQDLLAPARLRADAPRPRLR
ncbi:MAG: glycosyltransferase family 4 protein [Acidiphilium sp.]